MNSKVKKRRSILKRLFRRSSTSPRSTSSGSSFPNDGTIFYSTSSQSQIKTNYAKTKYDLERDDSPKSVLTDDFEKHLKKKRIPKYVTAKTKNKPKKKKSFTFFPPRRSNDYNDHSIQKVQSDSQDKGEIDFSTTGDDGYFTTDGGVIEEEFEVNVKMELNETQDECDRIATGTLKMSKNEPNTKDDSFVSTIENNDCNEEEESQNFLSLENMQGNNTKLSPKMALSSSGTQVSDDNLSFEDCHSSDDILCQTLTQVDSFETTCTGKSSFNNNLRSYYIKD